MFLLVSGRHVGAHVDGHQHCVSIQIYKFGENVCPHIFHKKNCCDLNLGESLGISTFFLFPDSGQLNDFVFFLFRSILNGVTLKTSNTVYHCCLRLIFDQTTMVQEQKYLRFWELFWILGSVL